ncbi:MAG: helix-turn-helix domain-containing protein [Acidithiobacillus sp.]|nr:helix-turn-helix domain-containing protein [Acidithiobacillus sp.]MDD5379167.1 helix-turn-helix domain-containing protein [Acidithiobacillus sp.]
MSGKEVKRLEVLRQVVDRVISQKMAAVTLGLSERQVRRLQRIYEAQGVGGLVSKRRGVPSNRRLPEAMKEQILARVREC